MPATTGEAVAADRKAKVITTDNQKYRFKRLEHKNDGLIGITKVGSVTSQKLAGVPAVIDGKNLEMDLSGLDIEKIVLRNKSTSNILTALTIAVASLVAAFTVFVIDFASSDWEFGKASSQ